MRQLKCRSSRTLETRFSGEDNIKNKTQCTYNVIWRCVSELLLPWKSNRYYTFLRVHAHACMYLFLSSMQRVCAIL